MAWSTRYDPASGIVEVVYTGTVTGDQLKEAATSRISLQQDPGSTLVLIDTSGIERLEAGTMEVFQLPSELYADQEATRESRLALVTPVPDEARASAFFYRTACLSRGWTVEDFESRQDAIHWLLAEAASRKPEAGG